MRTRALAVGAVTLTMSWGMVLAASAQGPVPGLAGAPAAAVVSVSFPADESTTQSAVAAMSGGVTPVAALPGAGPATVANPRTSWGPSLQTMEDARSVVAAMSLAELAGQVLVARYWSPDPDDAATLVRRWHLAGVILMEENIVSRRQVRDTAAAVQAAVRDDGRSWPAVVGVDQEGGRVARLGTMVTELPPFATFAAAEEVYTQECFARLGAELAGLGVTMDFAPVADVTIGEADPTIGDRSASTDPDVVAATVRAASRGLLAGGVVPVVKHFPGHGSVTTDSHLELPVQAATTSQLWARDLIPFRSAVAGGAPVVMVGHLDVLHLDPGVPSSLSPASYRLLREELGFEGVAVTDALTMDAIPRQQGREAVQALVAGADLVLMPRETGTAHAAIVAAVDNGTLSAERLTEAATRVVALQMWLAAR